MPVSGLTSNGQARGGIARAGIGFPAERSGRGYGAACEELAEPSGQGDT